MGVYFFFFFFFFDLQNSDLLFSLLLIFPNLLQALDWYVSLQVIKPSGLFNPFGKRSALSFVKLLDAIHNSLFFEQSHLEGFEQGRTVVVW